MYDTLKLVAAHMPGWECQELDSYRCRFNHADGRVILFIKYHNNKIEVFGILPNLSTLHSPSIGLSLNKSPERVARDLQRRLMPTYNNMWDEAQELLTIEREARESLSKTMENLRGIGFTKIGHMAESMWYKGCEIQLTHDGARVSRMVLNDISIEQLKCITEAVYG